MSTPQATAPASSTEGNAEAPADWRQRYAEHTRRALIDAAVALIERRQSPTMRATAAEAGVSERTIYRYFESHDALAAACASALAGRAGTPLCGHHRDLEDYAARLFSVFEANTALIEALLTTSLGDLSPTRVRNLEAMQRLVDEGFPTAPADERRAAAAALRTVLSGNGWHYQRRSCGLEADEVLANARWTIATVRARLASVAQG